jgi:hypothetical protein
MLNPVLAELQKLDKESMNTLAKLHLEKEALFRMAEGWNRNNDIKRLKEGAKRLEQIEFKMQRAWKFKEDSNKHTWKILYPGCTCPRPAQQNPYPQYNIVNGSCKIHGN